MRTNVYILNFHKHIGNVLVREIVSVHASEDGAWKAYDDFISIMPAATLSVEVKELRP